MRTEKSGEALKRLPESGDGSVAGFQIIQKSFLEKPLDICRFVVSDGVTTTKKVVLNTARN
jgi:hypothetical protein